VMRMIQHGISKRVVCYMLASIHYQVDLLKNDISRYAMDLIWYVGSRTVSRLNQIDVSYITLDKMYRDYMISWQIYERGAKILGHESHAVYTRWKDFTTYVEEAYRELDQKIDEVLQYIESKMDEVCTG